jgi:hypothetical protein
MGRANRALPGAAGALLPPGFLSAAAYFAASFRAVSAQTLTGLLDDHRLVHQWDAPLGLVEDAGKRQFANFRPAAVM